MKKAFTMLELVFVIVLIGILAAVMIPDMKSNTLREAATQVISHIRYTQHLAMVNDKFDVSDNVWYEKRWQIHFVNTTGSENKWSYIIYSDTLNHDGVANINDTIAKNPVDKSKYLTGGYSAGTLPYSDSRVSKELNIGYKYGIINVDFSDNCKDNSLRISFDHLGRPLYDGAHLLDEPYKDGIKNRLVQNDASSNPCIITLSNSSDSVEISIEPETGYVKIL